MTALISLIAGALLSLAFAPLNWWWLGVVALVVVYYFWLHPNCQRPAWLGFCFGLGYFGAGIHWVYISLYYFGGAPLIFAILANVILVVFLAGFLLFVGYLLGKLSAPNTLYRALLIPFLWLGAEALRAYVLSGFPWLSIGYSQLKAPLSGLAPLAGVFGVGLLLSIISTLFALALLQHRITLVLLALGLSAVAVASKQLSFTQPVGTALTVALVQGNVAQETKFDARKIEQHLRDYIALSATRSEAVIIWPETAIAFFESDVKDSVLLELERLFSSKDQTLVTGIPSGSFSAKQYYNAVIALGNGSGRYYKNHLLPFGEYLPLRGLLSFFEEYVDIPLSDFSRGGTAQVPLITNGVSAGVSICFEAAFGRDIRHALPQAQYLINVSNDSWFKNSIAADQHLQMNQMRSLEMGREMARATNNGITAFIDSRGNIKQRLPRFEQSVLSGNIQPRTGTTPYARYGNAIFALLMLAYAIIAGLIYPWRNRDANTLSTPNHRT